MGGGLLQLMALGPQNEFINGNPDITFFKKVYKKTTNFGIEQLEQTFVGDKSFGKRLRCKIERKGDLLKDLYIVIKLNNGVNNNYNDYHKNIYKLGFSIIDYVEIEIGGQVIDRHYGEWLDIWSQLSYEPYKYEMLMSLIKDRNHSLRYNNYKNSSNYTGSMDSYIYIPLQFWFNKDSGNALPLIALQYHEIILNIKFKELNDIKVVDETSESTYTDLYNKVPKDNDGNSFLDTHSMSLAETDLKTRKWSIKSFTGSIEDVTCYGDYIFLDVDERKMFAQKTHEYLIEQVQTIKKLDMPTLTESNPSKNIQFSLDFNNPVKEIIWTVSNRVLDGLLFYKNQDFTPILDNIVMLVNNIEYMKIKDPDYFNTVLPYKHHTNGGILSFNKNRYYNGGYYIYSFAIDPEMYQPNGTLNFSRLNSFILNFNYNKTDSLFTTMDETYKFTCYAINYNILKIQNGMGGLVYNR